MHRPTRDLDLLGFGSPDIPGVTQRIREICWLVEGDGILFDLAGIEGARIKEDAEYEGVRLRVPARLDGARIIMQIDVGFGDLVDPPPGPVTFPVLLPLAAPVIRGYPPEAVVAEKFHSMVVLGIANSRMKDFFDIWRLGQTHRFEAGRLANAVRNTFERRQTPVPEMLPLALTSEFLEDTAKLTQWAAFGKRLGLGDLPKLPVVGRYIAAFLMPVVDAARTGSPLGREWIPGGPCPEAYLSSLWRVTQAVDSQILIVAARRRGAVAFRRIFSNLRSGRVNRIAKMMSGAN